MINQKAKPVYNDPKGAAGALKTPLGLIPSYAMEQTALVHQLGAQKYGPYNWRRTGVCASTYVNAIIRHLNAWRDGETVDPESSISHLAHVACSCNILLDAGFCGTLKDDRDITPPNTPVSKMDKPTGAFVYPIAEPSKCTEGFVKSEGGFGYVSTFKIPIEFAYKAEAVEEPEECSCGRYKIRHFTMGLICEDCNEQWRNPC